VLLQISAYCANFILQWVLIRNVADPERIVLDRDLNSQVIADTSQNPDC